ncbi:glycosyltransferase [Terrabacter sp. Soil811]|uniref:glycosyltransferase n=1 Tax=Terrabacter sp. Soil811 TaxID=1736419 RepID=UPI000A4795FE|nr:glycosyltransferase [Terrabacter sp. Soil811]
MWALRVSHSAVVDAWRERERALRRRGHRVDVVSAGEWSEGGRRVALSVRPGEPVEAARTLGSHPALFLFDPRPLWRALGRPVEVIDVHEEPFALATAEVLLLRRLRRQRAPYLLYSAQNLDKRYPIPFRWLERAALRHAAGVNVCNDAAGRIVERKGFPGRARTIDLGTDLGLFTPPAYAVTPAPVRVVGFAGRLEAAKGADVLLRAVALEPDVRVRLAGDGPQRAELEALAVSLDIADRAELLGALAPEGLPDFYRSLDVLAVPSLTTPSWAEQFGRVAVEAMACGVPVVVSDSGALPEVVGDAALVVPEGDAVELAKALSTVAHDADVAAGLRTAGLARAAATSWDRIALEHEAMYRAATKQWSSETDPDDRPLEVVVVAYGEPDLLAGALAPLRGLSVIVVDNSSSAEVRAAAEAAGARYVDPGRNGGFGAGVNEALRRIDPRADVLLVNPDAVVQPRDVERLRAALLAEPDLASVGPSQVDATGAAARVEWPFPSPLATWVEAAGLGGLRRNRYVIGSVLMLRREALEHVGPFDDERFFLYAEETDWAHRAALLGWRHALVPTARATHVGAATSTDPVRREGHFHAAQEIYLRKHFGAVGWQVGRAGQVVGSAVRGVVLRGGRRRAARARVRLYLAGPARSEVRPDDARDRGDRGTADRPLATSRSR